ncbi:MAG: hypothetical protein EOM37_06595, partial [Proteobacteria bacterium]|nr:hypothetical protein [Pseudomonadota bacterium]
MLEKRRLANRKLCANHFAQASAFLTTRHRHQSGFAIAPVLYLLVLAGVASSVLFGGYSQILRGNVSVTNSQIVKTDLSGSLTTLAASAKLSTDGLLFCPPGSSTRSVECTPAPEKLVLFANVPAADSAKLPNNYSNVTTAGSPYEAGVFSAGSGLKQIDPWGHFYIYCRWENARATPDAPAIVLISAGKNAQVETTCGSTEPVGDDQMQFISVGAAIQRAAIWQESGSNVEYGQTGQKVIISNEGDIEAENILVHGTATFDSLHLTQPLPIVSGGTAADNIIDARINLGAGAVGDALFLATTTPGARGTLGATVIGDYLFSSATLVADTASAARLQLLGAGAIGNDLFVSETAPAARSVLGATAMGDYLFSSSSYDGVLGPAVRTTLLGSSAIGDAVFVAADTDTALTALGGTTVGKGVFTAATATAARTALGGGAVGSPLFTSPDQATAWTILGLIGGTATLDISVTGSAGSVDGANITGIVPIAHGGTSAVSASAALDNLFGGDSSPGVGTLNVDRLAANSIDSGKLTNVVTAGTYNNVTVDEAGRVVSGAMVTYDNSRITDGVGESIVATASDGGKLVFSTASAVRMVLDSIGNLGIGIEDPEEKLHIFGGNARISGPSDGYRELQFATSTDQMRWIMAADDATETGVGDAGSNLVINRFDDAGNEYNVLTIDRPTGNATFAGSVAATGGFLGYFTGTFDGTFIGTINSSINLGESTASPNPRRNGEANTGLYSDAAGQVQVSITGTERLRVTATGVVSDGVLSSDTM